MRYFPCLDGYAYKKDMKISWVCVELQVTVLLIALGDIDSDITERVGSRTMAGCLDNTVFMHRDDALSFIVNSHRFKLKVKVKRQPEYIQWLLN